MAQREHIPVAANVLGTIGTVCWCVQLIPQIWYNWRRKSTEGLPGAMLLLWAVAAPPFGVYCIVQNLNIPVQLQPQIFGVLALICWAQTLYYHNKRHPLVAAAAGVLLAGLFGGVEAVLIVYLRGPYNRGVTWPITLIGSIAAFLLAVGLIPPYYEIWKRNGRVVGINFIFLSIDFSGALFSVLSLAAQSSFDVLGGICYLLVLVLEVGIFICQGVWLVRTRKVRKAAKEAGLTYDQYTENDKKNALDETRPSSRSSPPETHPPLKNDLPFNTQPRDVEKGHIRSAEAKAQ